MVPNSEVENVAFPQLDIVFLKVCKESLTAFLFKQRFTLKECVELKFFTWFSAQFKLFSNFISDFQCSLISYLSPLWLMEFFKISINCSACFVQSCSGFSWMPSVSIFQNCWTSSSSSGSSVLFLDSWKRNVFFCKLAGCWLVAEIQFSYPPARVQTSLFFTPNSWFWLPGITCVG